MWINVALTTDASRAEAVSEALMAAGALSVGVEDAAAGTPEETPQFGEPGEIGYDSTQALPLWQTSRVTGLFEPTDTLEACIADSLRQIGLTPLPPLEISQVAEQDWVRLTQSQFDPICINKGLWIVPSWHVAPDPDAVNLVLDPGLAFGTGSHPTTFLCLQWLSDVLHARMNVAPTVLDYGCGSGILAIAAARLGSGPVTGVDIDANALIAARDNAVNNGVELQLQTSQELLSNRFDIVVANILTNPLCVLAPLLAGRVAVNGRIALSGVLASQAERVIAAYAPWIGLHVGATLDGWVRLEGGPC